MLLNLVTCIAPFVLISSSSVSGYLFETPASIGSYLCVAFLSCLPWLYLCAFEATLRKGQEEAKKLIFQF